MTPLAIRTKAWIATIPLRITGQQNNSQATVIREACQLLTRFIEEHNRLSAFEEHCIKTNQGGYEDGIYAGTRQDWIDRAFGAELKVEKLKAELDQVRGYNDQACANLKHTQARVQELLHDTETPPVIQQSQDLRSLLASFIKKFT